VSEMAELMDVFFNGRPARDVIAEAARMRKAKALLKGMHDKYHCKGCVCQVAQFLAESKVKP
jgi:hypothetical protein